LTHPALGVAVRRLADQQSARLAEATAVQWFRAKVSYVVPAGAADGVSALVQVSWHGNDRLTVVGYPDSYTPAVGHAVLCVVVDGQLSIVNREVGHP
jgi:hypothetical protein